jgi:hypothetical protein
VPRNLSLWEYTMPFDITDPETKAALEEAIEKATAPLIAKNRELLTEVKKAKKGAEVDPAEFERVETELEQAKAQLAEATKQSKATAKAAEDAAKALAAEQAHTQRLLINDGLTQALTAAGVKDPMHLKAAAALIRDEFKPGVTVDGDSRFAVIGEKKLGDWVKEWAGSDAGKSFVAAPHNAGGGATGGKGGSGVVNPWAPDSRNSTLQGQMYLTNPAQAKAMAAEHGVTLE